MSALVKLTDEETDPLHPFVAESLLKSIEESVKRFTNDDLFRLLEISLPVLRKCAPFPLIGRKELRNIIINVDTIIHKLASDLKYKYYPIDILPIAQTIAKLMEFSRQLKEL